MCFFTVLGPFFLLSCLILHESINATWKCSQYYFVLQCSKYLGFLFFYKDSEAILNRIFTINWNQWKMLSLLFFSSAIFEDYIYCSECRFKAKSKWPRINRMWGFSEDYQKKHFFVRYSHRGLSRVLNNFRAVL